jgi:uncharacterized phage protein gp47/JayE
MPLVIANPNNITANTLSNLQGNTKITNVSNGTIAQGIVQAVNVSLNQYYTTLTTDVAQTYISTATGQSLDLIGVLLNTPRGGLSSGSLANAQRFYVSSPYVNFGAVPGIGVLSNIIPAGTIVTSSIGSISYETVADVPFLNTDTSVLASVRASVAGSGSNVGSNILVTHNLNVPGILTTNIASINNGTDSQSDAEYRFFLSKAVTAAQAGNTTAVTLAALSVQGVSNIIPLPYFFGVGTSKIIVVGTVPVVDQGTLNLVQSAVDKVTSIGELVAVAPPRYIGIEVNVKLIFNSDVPSTQFQNIANQVQNNVYDFLNNIQIGQPFVRDQLITTILNTSSLIRDIDNNPTSPTYMKNYYWSPTTTDVVNGLTQQNFIKQALPQDYTAFFDDKIIAMQNVNGFVLPTGYSPVNVSF